MTDGGRRETQHIAAPTAIARQAAMLRPMTPCSSAFTTSRRSVLRGRPIRSASASTARPAPRRRPSGRLRSDGSAVHSEGERFRSRA